MRGVFDCTLGWGTGGGGVIFLERRVLLSFFFLGGGGVGEAFSPSIHCIPIRRH